MHCALDVSVFVNELRKIFQFITYNYIMLIAMFIMTLSKNKPKIQYSNLRTSM